MSRFLSPRLSALDAYTPGEQPQDQQYVKLNTNESPYPPSSQVLAALNSSAIADLRLYPDPDTRDLSAAIARRFQVDPDWVYTGNGSDDILNFTFMAFCDQEKGAAFPAISYGFYQVYGRLYGVDCLQIPLQPDFTIDPSDYYGLGRTIIIANPNAPTGLALSRAQVEQIVRRNARDVVLIDEAYVDFGAESCVELTRRYPNLIVAQTFSKSRSLAGGRLGFAIAQPELIADLNKVKFSTNPYCINRLTCLAGIAAIQDEHYFQTCCGRVIQTRQWTIEQLTRLGFQTLPSRANFIFTHKPGVSGKELYLALKRQGILVRHFDKDPIRDWLRITIGSPQDMQSLIDAILPAIKEVTP